jgi:hypothetical protein
MLSGNRFRVKGFLASFSVLVVLAGMLFGANISAAADSVQVQSYQRASQTTNCDSPPESMTDWRASWTNPYDPISGPTWHPSWERWANNGNGGWTCTRSITWARTPVSSGPTARSYSLGDIGPGDGLVFLISGGKTYEMAPKAWGTAGAVDPNLAWCNVDTNVATGTAIGTGAANTAAMKAACTSGAANSATAYSGGGFTDWFLPSKDELNAMCNYWINPTSPPTGACTGAVSTGDYGFTSNIYWSSSQHSSTVAWAQKLTDGVLYNPFKSDSANQRVRPIRSF